MVLAAGLACSACARSHERAQDAGGADTSPEPDAAVSPLRACYSLTSGLEEELGADGFRGLIFLQSPSSRDGCLHVSIRERRMPNVIEEIQAADYEVFRVGWSGRSCDEVVELNGHLGGAELVDAVGGSGAIDLSRRRPDAPLVADSFSPISADVTLSFEEGHPAVEPVEHMRFTDIRPRGMCHDL